LNAKFAITGLPQGRVLVKNVCVCMCLCVVICLVEGCGEGEPGRRALTRLPEGIPGSCRLNLPHWQRDAGVSLPGGSGPPAALEGTMPRLP